ncbi:hypothetical protein [Adlercreutzia murintestinalis]|uniref:hypothetical protein n=1 Tax=Adlercreutzia murintestinalis TaxID=2941325 RepID=UPI00204199FE|nr:hypothetical protein [Adlercreutzia murintestinalis]
MNAIKCMLPLTVIPEHRAASVSAVARAVSSAFGSPSFIRANGMPESGCISRVAARLRRRRATTMPVYQVDRRGFFGNERLPRIWVSEPNCGADGACAQGRRLSGSYPCGPDMRGHRALQMAEHLFAEGSAASDTAVSIACFQAAEILYLHASERGSVEALCRLGALYCADLCQGAYWRDSVSAHAKHAREDVLRKAVRALSRAAARGDAEAKWRLGDMRAQGAGCEMEQALAWNLYRGAFCRAAGCTTDDLDAAGDTERILALVSGDGARLADCGCAAVRMAACLEHGRGCERDRARASAWYAAAVRLLDSCVNAGSWLYLEELTSAESGAARDTMNHDGAVPFRV